MAAVEIINTKIRDIQGYYETSEQRMLLVKQDLEIAKYNNAQVLEVNEELLPLKDSAFSLVSWQIFLFFVIFSMRWNLNLWLLLDTPLLNCWIEQLLWGIDWFPPS